MCELISATTVAGYAIGSVSVLEAASLAATAYGVLSQGIGAANQAKYQEAVSKNNADIANYSARKTIEDGEREENQYRLKVKNLEGEQQSALAANGVDISSGTSLDILSDTAYLGELDALTIRGNAKEDAWRLKTSAASSNAEAGMYGSQTGMGKTFLNLGSSLVSSASSISSKWDKMKYSGVGV